MATITCGRYEAIDNGDGTFDILDVPVFATMGPGEKKAAPNGISERWLDEALALGKTRVEEGHFAPVHVGHSGDGPKTPAGTLELTRKGSERIGGIEKPCLYARLRGVPAAVFKRIEAGTLRYRSVEILDANGDPEIDSLALLETDVPHHKFADLTVRLKTTAAVLAKRTKRFEDGFAFTTFKGGVSLLCKFGDEKKEPEDGEKDSKEPIEAAAEDAEGDAVVETDDAEDTIEAAAEPAGGGIEALRAEVAELKALVQSLVQTLTGQTAGAIPASETGAVEPSAAPVTPIAAAAAKDKPTMPMQATKTDPDIAGLKGEVAGLRAKLEARETADAVASRIQRARTALDGYHVSAETEADIALFAKEGDAQVDRYVAGIKRVASKDPPRNLSAAESMAASIPGNDEDVAKFSKSPEQTAAARFAAAEYDAETNAGRPMRMSRERYIRSHPRVVKTTK